MHLVVCLEGSAGANESERASWCANGAFQHVSATGHDQGEADYGCRLLDFLRQEGWGEELDVMHEDDYTELSQTPFARKAAKLTPRCTSCSITSHSPYRCSQICPAWPKIREDAHAFMDDVRTIRLRVERQAVAESLRCLEQHDQHFLRAL